MSVILTLLVILAALVIILAFVGAGLSFTPRRARTTRVNEDFEDAQIELIEQHIYTTHPEIVHVGRMDRHEYYVGVLISLWCAGLGILLVPIGTGTIGSLPESTQKLLATSLIIGCTLSLLGATMGPPHRKWSPFRLWPRVFQQVGNAYGVGAGGQFGNTVALGFFGLTVFSQGNLVGTVTGLMTPILAVCSYRLGRRLWTEHDRLNGIWDEVRHMIVDGDDH